jgi:AcrR family transcriptional regulator
MATGSRSRNRESRAEKARATRRRVVEAACTLFVRDGYVQTTMAGIAREAGVAVQTLYLSFGSKVAVLEAAVDVTIAGDDDPLPITEREWYAQVRDEPCGERALRVVVDVATEVITRFYPLYAAVRAAAADPEAAELLERNKQQRFASFEQFVHELSGKAGYSGMPAQQAAEILYAVLSEETYGLLVAEHGWEVRGWSAWVERHVRADLFAGA